MVEGSALHPQYTCPTPFIATQFSSALRAQNCKSSPQDRFQMVAEVEATTGTLRHKHAKQLMKTEMCKFFLSSSCVKGSRCAYAHSRSEIREKPDLAFTSMCKSFLQYGHCDNPDCMFAHNEGELRTTTAFFKTKLCRFAASGRCKHGSECRFAHDASELKQSVEGAGAGMLQYAHDFTEADEFYGGASMNANSQEYAKQDLSYGKSNNNISGGVRYFPQRGNAGQNVADSRLHKSRFDWADLSEHISSDQSTRVEHSGSATTNSGSATISITPENSGDSENGQEALGITPEASGDSGQDENIILQTPHVPKRRGGNNDARRQVRQNGEPKTGKHGSTMMITNVPTFLPQAALVSLFEDLTPCMRGTFDFFYCPWNPEQEQNLGYAIVNFLSRKVAADFQRHWSNRPLLGIRTSKRLRIVPAALQGRAANIRHFSTFIFGQQSDPRFRPLVRVWAKGPLQPMAIAAESHSESNSGMVQQEQYLERTQAQQFHIRTDLNSLQQQMTTMPPGSALDAFDCSPMMTVPYPQVDHQERPQPFGQVQMPHDMPLQHPPMTMLSAGPTFDGLDASPMRTIPYPQDLSESGRSLAQVEQPSHASPTNHTSPWNGSLPGHQFVMLPAWPRCGLDEMDMQQQQQQPQPQAQQQQCFTLLAPPQVANQQQVHDFGLAAMYDLHSGEYSD